MGGSSGGNWANEFAPTVGWPHHAPHPGGPAGGLNPCCRPGAPGLCIRHALRPTLTPADGPAFPTSTGLPRSSFRPTIAEEASNMRQVVIAALAATALLPVPSFAAFTADSFELRNAGDLVDLCAVPE